VSIPTDAPVKIGDQVRIVPNHVCPVINLFDEAVIVEQGREIGRWRVAARGLSR
jgi:D-serine deaminase-like pyridoxal phosphate-dependent protein